MARHLRFVVPGYAHHITARGNYRQPIFFSEEDRHRYLRLLYRGCAKAGVDIHAYCLMPNHVHLVAVPESESSFSRLFQAVHSHYARIVHESQLKKGHLFETRFFSTVLDENHYWNAMVYCEANPVRAGLAGQAAEWKWSSAAVHVGLRADNRLHLDRWSACHSSESWRIMLESGISCGHLRLRIREATYSGWPLGDESFLDESQAKTGVRIRPLRRRTRVLFGTAEN